MAHCYKILYSNKFNKKNKNLIDGYLVINDTTIEVFDEEKRKKFSTRMIKKTFLSSSTHRIVEIDEEINFEDFSNKDFLKNKQEEEKKFIQVHKSLDEEKKQLNDKRKLFKKPLNIGKSLYQISLKDPFTDACYVLRPISEDDHCIYIEKFLSINLRKHQKIGVKFLFECLSGLKDKDISGCILADEMGLGKTVQTITLIWTLLKMNPYSKIEPLFKKVVIVTPLTLLPHWENEFKRWLGNIKLLPLMAHGSDGNVAAQLVKRFAKENYRCLLISYENFFRFSKFLDTKVDLLVFDEGHKLKNSKNKIYQTIRSFPCTRRLMLTGTPLQNSLKELFASVEVVCEGYLGSWLMFQRKYIEPITRGMRKDADGYDIDIAKKLAKELSDKTSKIILRRKADILAKFIPPKNEYFLFLEMTETQKLLYKFPFYANFSMILDAKFGLIDGKMGETHDNFFIIAALRKIMTYPYMILKEEGFLKEQMLVHLKPQESLNWESSPKLTFVRGLVRKLDLRDKLVIVSYFTQTLDLLEVLLKESSTQFLRLDGSTPLKTRIKNIDFFNDPNSVYTVFLLCAKAGGTGISLTGANRMVLMEVDWNPSNDAQVMGRIWREGQKKTVFVIKFIQVHIYRLFSVGTIEEKILQRQLTKSDLSSVVIDEMAKIFDFDEMSMKELFESTEHVMTFPEDENEKEWVMENNMDFDETLDGIIKYIKIRREEDTFSENDEENKTESLNFGVDDGSDEENDSNITSKIKKRFVEDIPMNPILKKIKGVERDLGFDDLE